MNMQQAKAITMPKLLAALGRQPAYVDSDTGEAWYLSPFREEAEASFKITASGRGWFDHGEGRGGSVIDFCCDYWRISRNDSGRILPKLAEVMRAPVAAPPPMMAAHPVAAGEALPVFSDVKIQPLTNPALKGYLSSRGIPYGVAVPFVDEIHYTHKGKRYFALAFKSKSGGYELRNAFYKGVHGNKDITLLPCSDSSLNSCPVHVYEGFMDFLSDLASQGWKSSQPLPFSVVVLNSASMRDAGLVAVQSLNPSEVHLFFDNDRSGIELAQHFRNGLGSLLLIDHAQDYAPHKDLNEWLQSKEKKHSL